MTRFFETDVKAISGQWLNDLQLGEFLAAALVQLVERDSSVDIVAIGKASREMEAAASATLGSQVRRRFIVCNSGSIPGSIQDVDVLIGDHPIPDEASLRAGRALLAFLDTPTQSDVTLFLVSGGASSLCALPSPPLQLAEMASVWRAALRSGIDITTLNMIRAATSAIAGGAVLRHVQTPESRTLIMVDNVISGAPWVASGLTFQYEPTRQEFESLIHQLNLTDVELETNLNAAFEARRAAMAAPVSTKHHNEVVADPDMLYQHAIRQARQLGYEVIEMGSHIHGDVDEVSTNWEMALTDAAKTGKPTCLVGVGEITVRVRGEGKGGRCQEFAWTMADILARLSRPAAFAARASDGRDYVEGVGGAWVDNSTRERAREMGFDWRAIKDANDSHRALTALGQLFEGRHTGWNLCDLYVAVL